MTEADIGIIRKAMAFRVKYRITARGVIKQRILLKALGVHPNNRGSVYPNEDRVIGLSKDVLRWGCDQDEADHNGVTVEEIPEMERAKYPQLRLERYTEYNQRKCNDKPFLKTCFEGTDILYGNLSHNHLLLVLLSWATAAKWDMPDFCDADGKLNLSKTNDTAFTYLIKEGLYMEKLSYMLMIEEPDGASLISQALNKGQEAACKTSELTAVAVLTGVITASTNDKLSGEVTYGMMKEKVRHELDVYVDEPEFIEMFDFIVSVGGNNAGYMKELLDFGDKFVDSKLRALRLSAFTEVNKMPAACPRSKIAVLKRAYRKKPSYGYCPSPEATWGKIENIQLKELENMLMFFHVQCEPAVAETVAADQRLAFLANVDVAACEAFLGNLKSKDRRQQMLKALAKYHTQLAESSTKMPKVDAKDEKFGWIDFASLSAVAEHASKSNNKKPEETPLNPKLLRFDAAGELIGDGHEKRVSASSGPSDENEAVLIRVPWRDWTGLDICSDLGKQEADMAAALGILRTLHLMSQHAPIEVLYDEAKKEVRVKALEEIAANSLELAPCVPKQSKLFKESSNPRKVPIAVVQMTDAAIRVKEDSSEPAVAGKGEKGKGKGKGKGEGKGKGKAAAAPALEASASKTENAAPQVGTKEASRTTYYIHPEWSMPGVLPPEQDESEPSWKWESGVSMHPFWAVRCLSPDQLTNENAKLAAAAKKKGKTAVAEQPMSYNCSLTTRQFTVCNVGVFQHGPVAFNLGVDVEIMTNFKKIAIGEELLLEGEKKASSSNKHKASTWKDAAQRPAKKAKSDPKPKPKAEPSSKKVKAMEL